MSNIISLIQSLFDARSFIPRAHCISNDTISTMLLASDFLIFLSYFVISTTLIIFVRKRSRVEKLPWVETIFFALCGCFVFSCGLSHLTDVAMMWWPIYRWDTVIRVFTALVSVITSILVVPVLTRFLVLPTNRDYEAMIQATDVRKNEMQALAEEASVTIFRADQEGRITYINHAWESLSGYTVNEVCANEGRGFLLCVHPEDRNKLLEFWETIKDDQPYEIEFRIVHKTNWESRRIRCTINRTGLGHFVGTAHRIKDNPELELFGEAMIENSPNALFMLNAEHVVLYVNPAAERLFGYQMAEMVGKEFHELTHHHENELEPVGVCTLVAILAKKVPVVEMDIRLTRQNDSCFDAVLSIIPFDRNGVLGSIAVIRDDAARRKTEFATNLENEVLKKANDTLSRANQDYKTFTYYVSHDLQEPLRAIGSFTQLLNLKVKVTDEEISECMMMIRGGVLRMDEMIRNLLEYTRVESKGTSFEEIRLSGSLKDAVAELGTLIADSGAMITVADESMPIVMADSKQIQRVFKSVIMNAIKYRRPGVAPEITIKAIEQDKWFWTVSVRDNGMGIEEQNLERCFQAFQSRNHNEGGGQGIGLSVCRKIMIRHGGWIWAESQFGVGSTFYFKLAKMDLFKQLSEHLTSEKMN